MTQAISPTTELANGVSMPTVGFGTWQIPLNEHFTSTIQNAIQLGYRQFDTAQIYNNAQLLGEAMRDSGMDRSEFFITCKVWATHRSYESAKEAFAQMLAQLQLGKLDMLLIHWPASQGEPMVWQAQNAGAWRALEEIYESGRVRAIGVANFLPHHLVPLLARARIKPMVNQLECHPGYIQPAALQFCKDRGIRVQAWSPLGRGMLLKNPTLLRISEELGISPARIALRWSLQHDLMPIPKATELPHQRENLDIFDFELADKYMKQLDTLSQTAFSGLHPDTVNF